MDLRHLRYFVAVAEELHFGKAAKRLSISQPPLSFAIRQLEEELEAKLLERDSKKVVLTSAGEAFLAEVRHLLAEVGEAKEVARRVARGSAGRLRVGFMGSMLYRGLPELVTSYRAAFPKVMVTFAELNSAEQLDAVLHGRLDVGFVHANRVPEGLEGMQVAGEPFVACLPEEHPLARVKRLDLRELANEPFVLFARAASPAYYETVIGLCVASGFQPDVRYEARNWLTVVGLVTKGMGVAVVPKAISASGMRGSRFVPLRACSVLSNSWCVWNPRRQVPPLAVFLQMARTTWKAAGR
jgi:DNA-binding transcriptional LysR family regulator